jgi:hypothetical protein
MIKLFSKNAKFIVLAAIIALGIFLRSYHFGDWLHFELDQSRDAKVIDLAVKGGPMALPLLGPKAAGSFLRLGPAFYYFKYISALVFGNTPSGIAVVIMLFGILAVPAFYLLVRRYFSKWISIALLLIFSTSLFLVMYSRFSWNPNALPLFTILTAYSLLRAVDREEKKKGLWLLLAAFSISVATQLHFLAYVSFPVITAAFLIIKRPKIKWQYWLGALGIILLMNAPVILNEIKTGGKNFAEFKDVIIGRTGKESNKTLIEKLSKDYTENSLGYFLILSSQNGELPGLDQNPVFNIKCDGGCRANLPLGVVSLVIFSAGIILLAKNLVLEKETKKKDFLMLMALWFVVAFGLFIPLSFDISPRFWLLVSVMPFIFLGFIFEFSRKILPKKIALFVMFLIAFAFTASNLYETWKRFNELKQAPYENVKVSADRILKEGHRVTLEQQYMVIDYMESFYKENKYPIYLNSDPFYRRSLLFHLDMKNIPRDDFRNVTSSKKVYANGNYFLVYPTDSNLDKDMSNYLGSYDFVSKKQFGTLTVIQLAPKPEAITATQQEFGPKGNPKSAPGVPERYTWEQIFNSAEKEGGDSGE